MTVSDEERAADITADLNRIRDMASNVKCRLNQGVPAATHAVAIVRVMDAALMLIDGIREQDIEQILDEQTENRKRSVARMNANSAVNA